MKQDLQEMRIEPQHAQNVNFLRSINFQDDENIKIEESICN